MFLTDLSIKRPVFATVLSLVLVIFGIVTFGKIPLRELPDVETAKVSVRVDYKGSSASIVDSQITQKIEDRVGGTPGVITLESKSQDGRSTINLEFDLGIDLDLIKQSIIAGDLVKEVSANLDGSGGGRKDFAMAGISSKNSTAQINDIIKNTITTILEKI